jgi:hypothetical protein
MDWKIDVDEAMFLGGLAKGGFCASSSPTSSSTTRPAMCAMQPDMFPRAMRSGIAHDNGGAAYVKLGKVRQANAKLRKCGGQKA